MQKGRKTKSISPSGAETLYVYNASNRLEKVIDPLGHETKYQYDALANVTNIINAATNSVAVKYDDLDLPKEITDTLSAVSKFTQNADGLTTQLEDNRSKVYEFSYNADGQRTKFKQPDNAEALSTYDADGLLTQWKPRGGQGQVDYTYDATGNMTSKSWSHGDLSGSYTLGYDKGRVVTATNTAQSVSVPQAWSYNSEGRVASFTQQGRTVSYGYDANGRTTNMVYPSGMTVQYVLNTAGQVSSIKKDGVALATYTYDSAGKLTSRTLANGVVTSYGYDGMDRITNIALTGSATASALSQSYGYDALGNRTHTEFADQNREEYQYDASSQLIGVLGAGSPSARLEQAFVYDPAGNRASTQEIQAGTTNSVTYAVNNLNQYTSIAPQTGTATLPTYNARGDLSQYKGWAYGYDAEGNLIKALNQSTTATATYTYDTSGDRVRKSVTSGGVNTTQLRLHSGRELIEEFNPTTNAAVSYIYEGGIDRPLARIDHATGAIQYYHRDVLGNVIGLADSTGTLVESYKYDVWGKPTILNAARSVISESAVQNNFLFTGREWDAETELYHYRSRSYNQDLGRFTQKDPIDLTQGELNLFRYVSNAPMRYRDPSGLHPGVFAGAVAGSAIAPGPGTLLGGVLGGLATTAIGVAVVDSVIDKIKEKEEENKKECGKRAQEDYDKCDESCDEIPCPTARTLCRRKCQHDLHYEIQRCNGSWNGPNPPFDPSNYP